MPRASRSASGFSVLEMLVVLGISLALMTLIVTVFRITTRTVKVVERKLALYEAARNVLDLLEYELAMAAVNERGEHFSIKSWTVQDADSFTRDEDGNPATADSKPYRYSRREGDAVAYVKLQAGAFRYAGNLLLPGSMAFALAYPEVAQSAPEAWKCSARSTWIYPYKYSDAGAGFFDGTLSRAQQTANVSLAEIEIIAHGLANQHSGIGADLAQNDPIPLTLAPGFEIKLSDPGYVPSNSDGREDPREVVMQMWHKEIKSTKRRKLGGIRAMDLDVAYWDDSAKKFVDPPDGTALYFWPPPKALRVTITVCDAERRGQLTLSRVVQLCCGTGDGQVANTLDTQSLDLDPQPFNRTKKLGAPNLEPKLLIYP